MSTPGYYWYPGDYLRDTIVLTIVQDGAYRRLLDHYYSTQSPLPDDQDAIIRITRAITPEEIAATAFVARLFFKLGDDGKLHNRRADEEIEKEREYKSKRSEISKDANAARWSKGRKKAERRKPKEKPVEPPPDHDPFVSLADGVVGLKRKELASLVEKHGQEATKWMVEKLANHKVATGTTYKSDYGAINSWVVTAYEEWKARKSRIDGGSVPAATKPAKYWSTCKSCGFAGNMKVPGACDVCNDIDVERGEQ